MGDIVVRRVRAFVEPWRGCVRGFHRRNTPHSVFVGFPVALVRRECDDVGVDSASQL